MNTYELFSRYKYCISRLSMTARASFSSARYVRSITAPVRKFLSFVRTNAPPLPGFTCWNSTTWKSTSSSSSVMPFLRSLVDTLIAGSPSQLDQLAAGRAADPAPLVGDLHHVLDPDAAEARHVDAGLDRHDRAGRDGP